jgi:hypothetical protein
MLGGEHTLSPCVVASPGEDLGPSRSGGRVLSSAREERARAVTARDVLGPGACVRAAARWRGAVRKRRAKGESATRRGGPEERRASERSRGPSRSSTGESAPRRGGHGERRASERSRGPSRSSTRDNSAAAMARRASDGRAGDPSDPTRARRSESPLAHSDQEYRAPAPARRLGPRDAIRTQTLLTSLVDAETFPADEIAALYHERWELELGDRGRRRGHRRGSSTSRVRS